MFVRFGDTSLQESINGDNYSILSFYVQQFKDLFPELCKRHFYTSVETRRIGGTEESISSPEPAFVLVSTEKREALVATVF